MPEPLVGPTVEVLLRQLGLDVGPSVPHQAGAVSRGSHTPSPHGAQAQGQGPSTAMASVGSRWLRQAAAVLLPAPAAAAVLQGLGLGTSSGGPGGGRGRGRAGLTSADTACGNYSGGNRRKLARAGALVSGFWGWVGQGCGLHRVECWR